MNEGIEARRPGRRNGAQKWAWTALATAALLLAAALPAAVAAAQQDEMKGDDGAAMEAGSMQDEAMQESASEEAEPMQDEAAAADATAAAPAPQPPPCDGEDFHRFDFWVGTWEVHLWGKERNPNPPINRISKILGGCALREEYTNPQGYEGTSINFFDPISKDWHQTWIDNGGQPLYLVGGWEDGSMVLTDDPQDARPKSRITWTPQDDGTVRQTWELSKDGGETWSVAFDGHYVPREES